jgi:hypothetical protein
VAVLAPQIEVRPRTIDLGIAHVGSHIVYDAFVIRNNGSADLTVDSLQVPGFITTDFHGPQTVASNRWYPVRIQFAPTEPRLFESTMIVYSSDYSSPTTIPVSGRGAVSELQGSNVVLEFDSMFVGQTTQRTLTLSDSGYWPTAITGLQFVNGSNFQISPVPQLPDTVPARGNLSYVVVFTPVLGTCTDTLIVSNDAGAPLRIVLHGLGLGVDGLNGSGVPTAFNLLANYPNPFNPSTTLTYDVARSAWITLTVYDVLGRAVDVPVKGMMQAGRYSMTWSCADCGSGIYFFVLSVEGRSFTQKAMLLR